MLQKLLQDFYVRNLHNTTSTFFIAILLSLILASNWLEAGQFIPNCIYPTKMDCIVSHIEQLPLDNESESLSRLTVAN